MKGNAPEWAVININFADVAPGSLGTERPGALQIGAAMMFDATDFVTNDERPERVKEVEALPGRMSCDTTPNRAKISEEFHRESDCWARN